MALFHVRTIDGQFVGRVGMDGAPAVVSAQLAYTFDVRAQAEQFAMKATRTVGPCTVQEGEPEEGE